MKLVSTRILAAAGLILIGANSNMASAGSVSMDGGETQAAKVQAYVDTYGAAASGNQVALENLRVLSRLYDASTLVEAADIAFDKHGILVYPSQASEMADAIAAGESSRQGG